MSESQHANRSGGLTAVDDFTGAAEGSVHAVVRDDQGLILTDKPEETAVLIGVSVAGKPGILSMEDSLTELALLAETAGLEVQGELTQRLQRPHPATFIGAGKLGELKTLVLELGANVVIFDEELSPRQQREIEQVLGEEVKVIDRTALILDIFARHAKTREGAVQVELAQYEYRLPRLTRAWTHLARQAGGRAGGASGGVGVRGPGETQLEVDRREIGRRIAHLKRELEEVRHHRERYRQRRQNSSTPVIVVVGYTNAGKSTLLNAVSDASVLTQDQLFATLDPTTRRVELPSARAALLTDTVGFIQKLPTALVAAFRATLEEITEADLLLHVVDISHANADEQVTAVEEMLEELGAGDKPLVTALNKIDLLDPDDWAGEDYPSPVFVSARTGKGIPQLLAVVDGMLQERMTPLRLLLPYSKGDLVSLIYEHGRVEREEFTAEGTLIEGRLPAHLASRVQDWSVAESDSGQAKST
jgi:GTP-binding protein HflX